MGRKHRVQCSGGVDLRERKRKTKRVLTNEEDVGDKCKTERTSDDRIENLTLHSQNRRPSCEIGKTEKRGTLQTDI